jgi:hypothetical protein
MSQSIPAPRDGAAPVASAPTRPRPWPSTRRILLPIVAAALLAVGSAGPAFACVLPPPQPPTSTPAPPTPTEGTCTQTPGGGDTCHVVTGSPSFTG